MGDGAFSREPGGQGSPVSGSPESGEPPLRTLLGHEALVLGDEALAAPMESGERDGVLDFALARACQSLAAWLGLAPTGPVDSYLRIALVSLEAAREDLARASEVSWR